MQENGVPQDEIPKLMQLIKPDYESITDILKELKNTVINAFNSFKDHKFIFTNN